MTVSNRKRQRDESTALSCKKNKSIVDFFTKSVEKTVEMDAEEHTSVVIEVTETNQVVEENVTKEKPRVSESSKITTLEQFQEEYPFDKREWIESLTEEQKDLLDLEINTIELSWLTLLHKELTKPYFIQLKQFLRSQAIEKKIIFPPAKDIYSWTWLTPIYNLKVLILGQDPYHNINQAHGLAFSVRSPTPPPPSLKNIYKCLKVDYPNFVIPTGSNAGNLEKWAERGVLMLNTCLTVIAHQANSHAKKGWEQFTENVIKQAMDYYNKQSKGFVVLAWGAPAQKRIDSLGELSKNCLVLKAVHPSPLSAHRGFFQCEHFKKCNSWLSDEYGEDNIIDWNLVGVADV